MNDTLREQGHWKVLGKKPKRYEYSIFANDQDAKDVRAGRTMYQKKVRKEEKELLTIAIDLDGTLAKNYESNHIPEPRPGAKKAVDELKRLGCIIIINTVRGNEKEVKKWCQKHDIHFDYINKNPNQPNGSSDKLYADVYIDDRAEDASKSWSAIMTNVKKRLKLEDQYKYPHRKRIRKFSMWPSSFGKSRTFGGVGGDINEFNEKLHRVISEEMRGEWWIDDSGYSTYADGSISDLNHEVVAFYAAIGINRESTKRDFIHDLMTHEAEIKEMGYTVEQVATELEKIQVNYPNKIQVIGLRFLGTDPEAIELFKSGGDARNYMMVHHNWIRVANNYFQMWNFDDGALNRIKDFISDEYEQNDENPLEDEFAIEELRKGGAYVTISGQDLLESGKSAAELMYSVKRNVQESLSGNIAGSSIPIGIEPSSNVGLVGADRSPDSHKKVLAYPDRKDLTDLPTTCPRLQPLVNSPVDGEELDFTGFDDCLDSILERILPNDGRQRENKKRLLNLKRNVPSASGDKIRSGDSEVDLSSPYITAETRVVPDDVASRERDDPLGAFAREINLRPIGLFGPADKRQPSGGPVSNVRVKHPPDRSFDACTPKISVDKSVSENPRNDKEPNLRDPLKASPPLIRKIKDEEEYVEDPLRATTGGGLYGLLTRRLRESLARPEDNYDLLQRVVNDLGMTTEVKKIDTPLSKCVLAYDGNVCLEIDDDRLKILVGDKLVKDEIIDLDEIGLIDRIVGLVR